MIRLGTDMTHLHLLLWMMEIEDVDTELPGNVIHDLTAAVNPLQLSNSYGIDLFIDCLNFLQSYMSS